MISSTPWNRVETLSFFLHHLIKFLCVSCLSCKGEGYEEGAVTSRGKDHSPAFAEGKIKEAKATWALSCASGEAYRIGDCLSEMNQGTRGPF